MTLKDKLYLAKISGWRAFVLLGLILFLAYSNTFDVPWQLDDYGAILANPKVQAQYPHLSTVAKPFVSFFETGHLNRPLALTTFAFNWYLGTDNTFGYHAVNLAVHILTAFFLFLALLALFETPRLKESFNPQQVIFISLLAATLWAVNPIQTQAITYIVQRMASMCAMFYILSIFFYVKARLSRTLTLVKMLLFTACGLSFLAAFLTKENAAMLPIMLLLVEAAFFQDLGRKKVRMTFLGIALAMAVATVIGGAVVFYSGNPLAALNYENRLFSPFERLLTQPRILLFYLTLIFYPAPNRLSLVHDIDISTSFFHPWTTLPSILVVFALMGFAIFRLRKWPILSFAVLFFFLNHVIESSIIPLELIFEHRNYLPAMFVFWPVAAGLERLIDIYRTKNATVYYGLLAFVPLLLVGMATGTYIRNIDWSSEKYLWEDAMRKAPRSSRPIQNLALTHYQFIGDHDTALVFYHRALGHQYYNIVQEGRIWNNIAAIHYFRGEFRQAAHYWQKAVEKSPTSIHIRYRLALTYVKLNRLDDALTELDIILSKKPRYAQALNIKGAILWKQNRPREALLLFRKCIHLAPHKGRVLINIGACFYSLGDYRKAELFFTEALRRTARSRIALLWRVQNQLVAGNATTVDADLKELLSKAPIDKLSAWLSKSYSHKIYKDEVVVPEKDGQLIESIQRQYLRKLDRIGE